VRNGKIDLLINFLENVCVMKNRLSAFLCILILGFFAAVEVVYAQEPKQKNTIFYRYTNEMGVKVVSQTIPPKYVRAGYELVSLNGEVLKVVAASPTGAEAERIAKEKKQAKAQARADLLLQRSYSRVSEIDAAKSRNLLELRNNINILQGSLLGAKAQLKDHEAQAAARERNSQKVSDELINNIAALRAEEKSIAAQIKQREVEYQAVADRYEQDKKRFIEISKGKPSSEKGSSEKIDDEKTDAEKNSSEKK
jgi:hypothetical protein